MLNQILAKYRGKFHPVVPYDTEKDKITALNLSGTNTSLTPEIFGDTHLFSQFIDHLLLQANAKYGIGGYLENRKVYARSRVFDATSQEEEPRTLHLGVDIWGKSGTKVMAPLDSIVHSTGNHPEYGNYGAIIILEHLLDGVTFYTLYGHLSFADLVLQPGQAVTAGEVIAHFGKPEENGHWPPHLHFQVMADMQGLTGDYPGVCAPSAVDAFKSNCPDPMLLLKF